MQHFVLGTAGHVDHGKTSLIKALTGIDTDRLKEEKERGITIELGFASLGFPPAIRSALSMYRDMKSLSSTWWPARRALTWF